MVGGVLCNVLLAHTLGAMSNILKVFSELVAYISAMSERICHF